jgi:hypothetical protein
VRRHGGNPVGRRLPSCEETRTATNMAMNLLSQHKPAHTNTPRRSKKVPNKGDGQSCSAASEVRCNCATERNHKMRMGNIVGLAGTCGSNLAPEPWDAKSRP